MTGPEETTGKGSTISRSIMRPISKCGLAVWLYKLSIASMTEYAVHRRSERRAKRLMRRLLSKGTPVQLDVGSITPRAGWITVHWERAAELALDLTKPLPFPDNSVDRIYTSHRLDHLHYEGAMMLLKESYRILKNGGTFSVCVPDASFYLEAYCSKEVFDVKRFCPYDFALHYHSPIDLANYIAYLGGQHHYMYDGENLVGVLRSAGFQKVALRDFDPDLDLEKPDDHRCVYAVAVKQPA